MINPFETWAEPIIRAINSDYPVAEMDEDEDDFWPKPDEEDDRVSIRKIDPLEPPRDLLKETDGEWREQFDKLVNTYGIECLAFYKSIHHRQRRPFRGRWGVFFSQGAISVLGERINQRLQVGQIKSERLAFQLLHSHELYHFLVDGWSIAREGLLLKRLYSPYLCDVYKTTFPTKDCVEEELANLFMLDRINRIEPNLHSFAEEFCRTQPPAYQISTRSPKSLRAKLASRVLRRQDWLSAYYSTPKQDQMLVSEVPEMDFRLKGVRQAKNCPCFLVSGVTPSTLVLPFVVPVPSELGDFVERYLDGKKLPNTHHPFYVLDNGEKVKFINNHREDRVEHGAFTNIRRKAGPTLSDYKRERMRTNVWKRGPRERPLPPLR